MLRFILVALALLIQPAAAQQVNMFWSCGTGLTQWCPINTTNKLPVAATFSGTADMNLAQVAGATVGTGHGLAAGTLRVELPTDGTGVIAGVTTVTTVTTVAAVTAITNALPAGTNIIGNFRIDQTTPGTTNAVQFVNSSPVVSTTAEANHVLSAGAAKLQSITVTIGATSGYLLIFNATSAPVDGAVTPLYCLPVISNGTNGGVTLSWPYSVTYSTGITASFSTTGCFTKTASATANFFAQVQ